MFKFLNKFNFRVLMSTLAEISKFLKDESGQHTTNIYMPSIKRDVPFKPLTTADVKTLSRIRNFQ